MIDRCSGKNHILAQSVLSEIKKLNVSKIACMLFSKGHSVDIKQREIAGCFGI